jgi:hypothetical protein
MTTGCFNTVLGHGAGPVMNACCNVFVGGGAGCVATSGNSNTFIGDLAGCNVTTGSRNIAIGQSAVASTPAVSNEVTLFNGCAVNGTARFQGTAGAWSFSSDERLKQNITALPVGLSFVEKLQPRQFEWKADGSSAAGFIAQEIDAVVADHDAEYLKVVVKNNPDSWEVAATHLIPVLVNAVKELKAEVDALKEKLA